MVVVLLVVVLVVELVELVLVELVLLVLVPRQADSRHSPVTVPATGGSTQGHSAGQSPPTHWVPSQVLTHGLPQWGVVLVVVGGRVVGGGQGQGQGVV